MSFQRSIQTQVLIIGAGATGTSLARDLALRGVESVVVEKGDVNAGASGRNHGLLHSGARYVAGDLDVARECRVEGTVLRRIAAQAIEDTKGYFVALAGDDERYIADFPSCCERAGIAARAVDIGEGRAREPSISQDAIAVFEVPDASIDPFRLSLETMAHAQRLGARLIRRAGVEAFEREGRRLRAARVRTDGAASLVRIEATQIVNAAGAWARSVAELAGAPIAMTYSKGALLVTHARLATRVLNRLRRPGNGDIVMPGGTVSIVGTTSTSVDAPDGIHASAADADLIIEESARMVPALATMRYVRAFAGVRPLVGAGSGDARAISRGFALFDHEADGLDNFATITGGKLTTCRLMAERTADLVCRRLGIDRSCLTSTTSIPPSRDCAWTEPGRGPAAWVQSGVTSDPLLCECEMTPASAVDAICDALRAGGEPPSLVDVGLRSRLGKGPCQGTFCAVRAAAHLCRREEFDATRSMSEIRNFIAERWGNQRPVLWGPQLGQAELAEAIHCGVFGEELLSPADMHAAKVVTP